MERREERGGGQGGQVLNSFAHMHARTHRQQQHMHAQGAITRSADRSISSRLRAGESLAMVLSVDPGLKMEASSTTIDREVHAAGRARAPPGEGATHTPGTNPRKRGLERGGVRGAPGAATCCSAP